MALSSTADAGAPDDHGFTLLEVMVTILVIGILLAVGVPTYQGARDRSQNSAAQQSLYDGIVAATIVYTDELDFADADATGMARDEPSLSYVASPAPSTHEEQLSVTTAFSDSMWAAAVLSDSGTCFYARTEGRGDVVYASSTSSACTGGVALTIPAD